MKPTITEISGPLEGSEMQHPAYALLSVNRTQGGDGTALFGSQLKHRNTIHLTISSARQIRRLNYDSFFQDKEIIEVEMSETQWGRVVSSFNIGNGTPVTILHRNGAPAPVIDHEQDIVAQFNSEMDNEVKEKLSEMSAAVGALELMAQSGKVSMKTIKEAAENLRRCVSHLPSNAKYINEQFVASTNRVVNEAKTEFEGHVANVVLGLGADTLRIGAPLLTSLDSNRILPLESM